jgi:hypothetical protein
MMRDRPNRRRVLVAGAVLAAAAAAPAAMAKAADLVGPPSLTLFDPDEPAARVFAASRGGASIAIEGDRIRLARRLLTHGGPDRLTVIGRHADLILLADAAREHGYRLTSLEPFPAMDGRPGLFIGVADRRI